MNMFYNLQKLVTDSREIEVDLRFPKTKSCVSDILTKKCGGNLEEFSDCF